MAGPLSSLTSTFDDIESSNLKAIYIWHAHTYICFSIPFIKQRAGSQTTAIYLWCINDMLRAYNKQRAIVILPEHLEPACRAKHTSYVNRNYISLDCLGLLSHLLFRCWQGKWFGPVGLSIKVREVTWGWRFRSPGRKSFLFRRRDRTLQGKKVRGSHSMCKCWQKHLKIHFFKKIFLTDLKQAIKKKIGHI